MALEARIATFRLVTLSMAMLMGACSSNLLSTPGANSGEVETLKRLVTEWQKRATVAELENERLKRKVARLEADQEENREAAAPVVESVEETRPTDTEPLEEEPTASAAIGLDQEIEETDLDEPPPPVPAPEPSPEIEIADREPVEAPTAEISAESAQEAVAETSAPSESGQALYDEGYTLFHQKRYEDAEARFSRYIELYPQTDLADNALFWIGECRYAQGELSSALEAFTGAVERYPHSNKVSDALFKAGKCLEALGNTQQAVQTYEEVVARFPGSSSAARARDRLVALR